jgi:hypothetical protein
MQKFSIPYLSLDILMMGFCRSTLFSNFTPIDEVEKISKYVWPVLKEKIFTNIENI